MPGLLIVHLKQGVHKENTSNNSDQDITYENISRYFKENLFEKV